MIDTQIVAAAVAAVPTMTTVLIGILINNSRQNDMNVRLTEFKVQMDTRLQELDRNFDNRFQDLKETWRAELHRVEEVLDARLKHLEER